MVNFMTKADVIQMVFHIMPQRYFDKWRRNRPMCDYNFHSPIRVRLNGRKGVYFEPIASCVHCGATISRGHDRQWHILVDLSQRFDADEVGTLEPLTFLERELETS